MTTTDQRLTEGAGSAEVRPAGHVDVLVVGAGLSGIGAAAHLLDAAPSRTWALLEARDAIGGTWDLFRYPGVRSDSDMFTLAYGDRPWRGERSIAEGRDIAAYVRETAAERGIDRRIRFGRRVLRAEWDSPSATWTVDVEVLGPGPLGEDTSGDAPEGGAADAGGPRTRLERWTCGFLYLNTGYYRYDAGHTPDLPGLGDFAGLVVHPQHWPVDLDVAGRRVVVIGSGATAISLVPALAAQGAAVTMLQRSPSYVVSQPGLDPFAERLRRRLPAMTAHRLVRARNVALSTLLYQSSRRAPRRMRALIRKGVAAALPAGYDVDTHFNPRYEPWDQRLCLVPDGDLFAAISSGSVQVVTERIEGLDATGIRLASGDHLDADVVVTATGLEVLWLGGIDLVVDGRAVEAAECVEYRGCMLSDVPNLAFTFGYINASWTLKADLIAEYVCRVLDHMARHDRPQCTPRPADPAMPTAPLLALSAGYVRRAEAHLPRQGVDGPWRKHQNYLVDRRALRPRRLDDGHLVFSDPRPYSVAGR